MDLLSIQIKQVGYFQYYFEWNEIISKINELIPVIDDDITPLAIAEKNPRDIVHDVEFNLIIDTINELATATATVATLSIAHKTDGDASNKYTNINANDIVAKINELVVFANAIVPPQPLIAFWLTKNNNTVPTESEFRAANQITITDQQANISYPVNTIGAYSYFFFAEPLDQPEKTYKYNKDTDQEELGDAAQINTRLALTTLGYYAANYITIFDTPTVLKTMP